MIAKLKQDTQPQAADGLLPVLASAYIEQGSEAGYHRGVNDVLSAYLDAVEEFITDRVDPAETRKLLHQFSEVLEQRFTAVRPLATLVDGLGI